MLSLMKHYSHAVAPLFCLTLGLGLSACDSHQSPHEQLMSSDTESGLQSGPQAVVEGNKLTDVAGQVALPKSPSGAEMTGKLGAYELNFVGRYHTQIACEDTFVDCEHGKAEYILNLLPDGTAHRMIVHYGRVHTENDEQQINQSYRIAHWRINRAKKELVIAAVDGHNFYYQIDNEQHLVMQVDKNRGDQETNRPDTAEQSYFVPSQPYVLSKDKDNEAVSEVNVKS